MGGLGAMLLLAAIAWVPLHFSGKSILYNRATTAVKNDFYKASMVQCFYFTSTGTEETFHTVGSPDAFYCPRIKDIGQ